MKFGYNWTGCFWETLNSSKYENSSELLPNYMYLHFSIFDFGLNGLGQSRT